MNKVNVNDYKDVWVFAEVQDHERIFEGVLELLARGRGLADKLGQKLCAVLFALDAEQYIPALREYGPDLIYCSSSNTLKHYNSQIYPDMIHGLVEKYKPSIILLPATEAGTDLAPRLAKRSNTGLTTHCTELDIVDLEEYSGSQLLMKRPAFSGNMVASILCPHTRPQIATVQPGVFDKAAAEGEGKYGDEPEIVEIKCTYDLDSLKIVNLEAPKRWDKPRVPLESAPVIVAGGRGLESKKVFDRLYDLAELLGAEVGATRVPVFNKWCAEERMIGQTGKTIRPEFYIGFGISGQIQHTASIVDSGIIVSVNLDPKAPMHEMSDYVVVEDACAFIDKLITKLKMEKRSE